MTVDSAPSAHATRPQGLIGARIARVEDELLVSGRGRYIADLDFPSALQLTFVRSPHAHARIRSIDRSGLLAAFPDALVFTGADIPDIGIRADINKPGAQHTFQPCLAKDVVRFAGEAVAAVLTRDPYVSEDAAELLAVEYEPLSAVVDAERGLEADAPILHPGWRDNAYVRRVRGGGDMAQAERDADLVVRRTFRTHRHTGVPMECRGCVASVDPSGTTLTLWSSTQVPHMVRSYVASQLNWPENRIRVVAPNVGGGFGIKGGVYGEEVLMAWLAIRTGRPVRWIEDRREHLQASAHAREHLHDLTAYVRSDGRILGLRARVVVDSGAYSAFPWTGGSDAGMTATVLPGPYDIRNYEAQDVSVATNKCPVSTYRGVGRPSAAFSMERLLDEIARELGMDPIEIRQRNVVREFPYHTTTGLVYDSGSYAESLDRMKAVLDWDRLRAEHKAARARGQLIGVGVALFCEQTAHGTAEFVGRGMPIVAGYESVRVEIDPQGSAIVSTGLQSHGQGMETSFAQIAAEILGLRMDRVMVLHGDTANSPYAMGTWGSRGSVLGGGATAVASGRLRDKLLAIAAHALRAPVDDLVANDGQVCVQRDPVRAIAIGTLARWALQEPQHLPPGMPPGLSETAVVDGVARGTFSNACHAAVVQVDQGTGQVTVLRYVVVEDCGRMINPMIVEGQIHGGVAQGIGSALLEELVYTDDGQLLTTTLADYLLPLITDVPQIEVEHIETLSPLTPLGNKGMGEAGAIGPMGTIGNAVSDALGVCASEVPLTPPRVWQLLAERGPRLEEPGERATR